MKIKILSQDAITPKKSREGDAAFDLYSPIDCQVMRSSHRQIKLGIAIEINKDEVALVQERSGLALKNGLHTIGNVIDSNYRGEISAIIQNNGYEYYNIKKGDRIAQLLILKLGDQKIEVVDTLSDSSRGDQGYGSSGK